MSRPTVPNTTVLDHFARTKISAYASISFIPHKIRMTYVSQTLLRTADGVDSPDALSFHRSCNVFTSSRRLRGEAGAPSHSFSPERAQICDDQVDISGYFHTLAMSTVQCASQHPLPRVLLTNGPLPLRRRETWASVDRLRFQILTRTDQPASLPGFNGTESDDETRRIASSRNPGFLGSRMNHVPCLVQAEHHHGLNRLDRIVCVSSPIW